MVFAFSGGFFLNYLLKFACSNFTAIRIDTVASLEPHEVSVISQSSLILDRQKIEG